MLGLCMIALLILSVEHATAHKHQNGNSFAEKNIHQMHKARLSIIDPRSSIWHQQQYCADYCDRRYR